MTTLRDLWIERGWTSTRLAGLAGVSIATLYKMNRREKVSMRTIDDVCRVLKISRQEYDSLLPCPQAERYKEKE